jgi:hypothetical protein
VVHLPRKNQDLPESYGGGIVEDMSIFYNGSSYGVYGELTAAIGASDGSLIPGYDWRFGQLAREALQTSLSPSTHWKLTFIGPTPIHPLFTITILPDSSLTSPKLEFEQKVRDVMVTAHRPTDMTDEQLMKSLVKGGIVVLGTFYSTQSLRSQMISILVEIYQEQRTAAELYEKLSSLPWWQPWRMSRYGLIAAIRKCVARAYRKTVALGDVKREIHQQTASLCEIAVHQPLLSEVIPYLEESCLADTDVDLDSVMRNLRFLEEEIRSLGIQRATVEAAVVWGLVGGVVIWLLSLVK